MSTHLKVLGAIHLAFGLLGIVALVILLLIFAGGFTFLNFHTQTDAPLWLAGIIGTVFAFITLVASLPSILCGYGLLRRFPWARIVGIVLSILYLVEFPFGTALGIYGLWVLFHMETPPLFRTRFPYHPDGAAGTV